MPLVASLGILVTQAWRETMFKRRKAVEQLADTALDVEREQRIKAARLPRGCVSVNTWVARIQASTGLRGSLMLVGTGSYGANMLILILSLLYMSGLEWLVGSIFLGEHDATERDRFAKKVHPIFSDRINYGFSPTWSGGFANRSVDYVLDRISLWGNALRQAAYDVAYFHEHSTGRIPGQIIYFWSQGGQAPIGLPVLEVLQEKFPEVQKVGMTSLPKDLRNRRKFAQLKAEYEKPERGIAGWVVSDRLLPDWKTADYCMAALIVAPSDAQLFDDQSTQLKNILALAFTEQPGSIIALQFAHQTLPAYEWNVEGEHLGYYVQAERAHEVVERVLRTIEEGKAQRSAEARLGEPGTSIYDIVVTPFGWDERHQRNDLLQLSDTVRAGYAMRLERITANGGRQAYPGLLYDLGGHELVLGSVGALINADKPEIVVVAMRVAAIQDGAHMTHTLAAVSADKMLPHERAAALLTTSQVVPASANGKEGTP
ncbi:MAG TPA: hypothetical protein VLA19_06765 [Herpetosiphonaceae bacterium]|nr:hypothetical protein [Herpetosiphonaceae bacterium]